MKLISTTQLAAKLGVSGACVRQWRAEERIAPIAYDVRGNPLYASTQKKPQPRHKYPVRKEIKG